MFIAGLTFKGFRGFSFKLDFTPGINMMVGMNGCGKTTTMEMLAILAGHDRAIELIRPSDTLEYAEILVHTTEGPRTLKLFGGFDLDKIAAFKRSIKDRASYVLQQDCLDDDSLVTARREPVECQQDMLKWLKKHQLGIDYLRVRNGQSASMLVSETGAQRYLLICGMRRAPSSTPMLLEHPERNLHVILKRCVVDFYQESTFQQIILTTHCPEVLSTVLYRDNDSTYLQSLRKDEVNVAIDLAEHRI